MGHRALVAYRLREDTYSLHYSHSGAHNLELEKRITHETPLGGEDDFGLPAEFLETLAEAFDADPEEDVEDNTPPEDSPKVNPEPIHEGVPLVSAMSELDEAWYEAFYVVYPGEEKFDVVGYHVLSDLFGDYLLINPRRWGEGERDHNLSHQRGWFNGLKAGLKHQVENGDVRKGEANAQLLQQTLEKYEDGLNKHILAHSPAITDEMMREYPEAFIEMGGRSRVLGEMYPKRLEAKEHQIPEGFPSVKTADGERVTLP